MNLVAKEYVAAQDPQDPGVLILSKFAGAAEELTDALIVNPNDKVEVAEAIQHALHMSREERVARWQAMSKVLWNSDTSQWAATFIKDLAANKASRARSSMVLAKKGNDDR
jgi:trehalose 6-phosphate synthase